jgi:hypothetical protein
MSSEPKRRSERNLLERPAFVVLLPMNQDVRRSRGRISGEHRLRLDRRPSRFRGRLSRRPPGFYVSATITEAGTDRSQSWRLAAQEIARCVIGILADALTSPAGLLERLAATTTSSHPQVIICAEPKVCGLAAGGEWIRTSSTRKRRSWLSPLFLAPIASDRSAPRSTCCGSAHGQRVTLLHRPCSHRASAGAEKPP